MLPLAALCLGGFNCLYTCVTYLLCVLRKVYHDKSKSQFYKSRPFEMYNHITLLKTHLLLNAKKKTKILCALIVILEYTEKISRDAIEINSVLDLILPVAVNSST